MPLNPGAGSFNPNAYEFVPGQFSAPAPAATDKPAEEASESWEEEANVEVKTSAPKAPEPTKVEKADPVEDATQSTSEIKINDEELKAELAKMKAEGLLEEDEEEEIIEGKTQERPHVQGKTLKRHLNIVFVGHVDAGKSTISGHIMYLSGQVDERTMEKYEREAKAKHRESWKFAWCMDTTDEERAKGKTQECGRGAFETEAKNYTILDAPGHKNFVPHMIGGAAQADVAVLVISVRKGEFEAGFDRGGQSREHAVLAKTAGVKTLIVAINKMDDPSVCLEGGIWDEARYKEVCDILEPFLKQTGFNTKTDVFFMPVSGFTGANLKDRVDTKICPWYNGPSLLEFLDQLQPAQRFFDLPLRFPIADKYKEMGTCVMGKLEAGTIRKGENLVVLPNKTTVSVEEIFVDHKDGSIELSEALPGDNIKMKLKGVEEESLRLGFVICRPENMCRPCRWFDATVQILDYPTIICAGYSCVLHIHSAIEECTFYKLLGILDKKTRQIKQKEPKFCKQGDSVLVRVKMHRSVCVERYKDFSQMGRFMLRDQGNTIGVGIINDLKFPEDKKKEAQS
uniref:Tr-type G domain-containing protein n=1 Tax=Hanusia phi TaxID=3032 RepID=A0A7S0I3M1_9CRYP|mmetsp:Transcript_9070/g.20797  ORF Transcript_9070/g.20797 Transcript_9070/m.20797 type:complete len:569 (+) Transcript_9070:70-1776(+)